MHELSKTFIKFYEIWFSARYTKDLHEDEVRQIQYSPQLGCFLSCCSKTNTSMYLGDIEKRLHSAFFKVIYS